MPRRTDRPVAPYLAALDALSRQQDTADRIYQRDLKLHTGGRRFLQRMDDVMWRGVARRRI